MVLRSLSLQMHNVIVHVSFFNNLSLFTDHCQGGCFVPELSPLT